MGEAVGPEGLEQVGKEEWVSVFSLLGPHWGHIMGQDKDMMAEYSGQGRAGGAGSRSSMKAGSCLCSLWLTDSCCPGQCPACD